MGSDRVGQNDLKDGWVRPVGALFRYGPPQHGGLARGKRGGEDVARLARRIARGSTPHDLLEPAEVWTPRILGEAVRRFYLRLFDRRALLGRAPAVPTIEFESAWHLPKDPNERAKAEDRANAEGAWLEGVGLRRRGRRRFERFGRDPGLPLG